MKLIILMVIITLAMIGCAQDCPVTEEASQEYSIAYVNNCETGQTDKYICIVETGNCTSTEEILSELG